MLPKIVLPMVALFVLAACASPGELRQKPTNLSELTNAPVDRVAGCIGDKLEGVASANRGRLSSRPTSNGYSISIDQTMPGLWSAGGTDTIVLVDISKTDNKTRVQLFTHFLMGDGGVPALVRECL